jgi:hypothetical protein
MSKALRWKAQGNPVQLRIGTRAQVSASSKVEDGGVAGGAMGEGEKAGEAA